MTVNLWTEEQWSKYLKPGTAVIGLKGELVLVVAGEHYNKVYWRYKYGDKWVVRTYKAEFWNLMQGKFDYDEGQQLLVQVAHGG